MLDACKDCGKQKEVFFANDAWRCEPCALANMTKLLSKRIAFQHGFVVCDYVGVRHVFDQQKRYGRIVEVVLMNGMGRWTPRDKHGNCHAKLRIQMDDGTFREEHPEHLCQAKRPLLTLCG